jgi:hypothetical protein
MKTRELRGWRRAQVTYPDGRSYKVQDLRAVAGGALTFGVGKSVESYDGVALLEYLGGNVYRLETDAGQFFAELLRSG